MDEYIKRDALVRDLIDHYSFFPAIVKNAIERQPTADVEEVRHGEWMPQVLCGQRVFDCSECKTLGNPAWKRCPVCEAKMDGKGDA